MNILDRVLSELRAAKGPIRSTELASRIGVSEAALDGMVSVLVSKGKLTGSGSVPVEETVACSGVACGSTCVGLDACPFIADVPETYALVIDPVRRG